MLQNAGIPSNMQVRQSTVLDPSVIEKIKQEKEAEYQAILEQKGAAEAVCISGCYQGY